MSVSADLVFRRVKDEVITIHTQTGQFHYFSSDAEIFFKFFNRPARLESFFQMANVDEAEREYLEAFVNQLIELKIVERAGEESVESLPAGSLQFKYGRPEYLRPGEKTLDNADFAYLYG
jgi:hypothetical protein